MRDVSGLRRNFLEAGGTTRVLAEGRERTLGGPDTPTSAELGETNFYAGPLWASTAPRCSSRAERRLRRRDTYQFNGRHDRSSPSSRCSPKRTNADHG